MTDLQKQNLGLLIKTSPVLSDQERGEWLMLLDLMNDKQVGELERILKPAKPAFVPPPVVPNLPLKHIVNLPVSDVAKNQTPPPRPVQDKTFSKFAEHLNKILAEKDLPKSDPELDLPAPVPAKPVAQTPKSIVQQPKPVLPPKPVEQPKPKPQPVHAGLQNQDALFQAAVYKQPKPVVAPKAELSSSLKLVEPSDVAMLQPQNWTNENHAAITQVLKEIISKRGYHEVIFNLQNSPLYNLYIDTGLKSLESANRFEALGENYLNKKQFEDFTDLLRELQV